jgi:hypothetical protein
MRICISAVILVLTAAANAAVPINRGRTRRRHRHQRVVVDSGAQPSAVIRTFQPPGGPVAGCPPL